VEVGGAQRCAPRLIRAWVRPDGLGRPAGPPQGPGGGRVSEPELSPSLVMLATETGVAWGLHFKLEPACDTEVAGRGRDLDGMPGELQCAAHRVRSSPIVPTENISIAGKCRKCSRVPQPRGHRITNPLAERSLQWGASVDGELKRIREPL
jgi:hypothetical protein